MLQIFGVGAPFLGLGIQALVWLYIIPLMLALIGLGLLWEGMKTLYVRRDLATLQRFAAARYQAGQGLMGLAASALFFVAIFFRKELIQCVSGIF